MSYVSPSFPPCPIDRPLPQRRQRYPSQAPRLYPQPYQTTYRASSNQTQTQSYSNPHPPVSLAQEYRKEPQATMAGPSPSYNLDQEIRTATGYVASSTRSPKERARVGSGRTTVHTASFEGEIRERRREGEKPRVTGVQAEMGTGDMGHRRNREVEAHVDNPVQESRRRSSRKGQAVGGGVHSHADPSRDGRYDHQDRYESFGQVPSTDPQPKYDQRVTHPLPVQNLLSRREDIPVYADYQPRKPSAPMRPSNRNPAEPAHWAYLPTQTRAPVHSHKLTPQPVSSACSSCSTCGTETEYTIKPQARQAQDRRVQFRESMVTPNETTGRGSGDIGGGYGGTLPTAIKVEARRAWVARDKAPAIVRDTEAADQAHVTTSAPDDRSTTTDIPQRTKHTSTPQVQPTARKAPLAVQAPMQLAVPLPADPRLSLVSTTSTDPAGLRRKTSAKKEKGNEKSSPAVGGQVKVNTKARPGLELNEMEEDLTCPICMSIFAGAHVISPCGHAICGACGSEWLRDNDTCPICRKSTSGPSLANALVPCHALDGLIEKWVAKKRAESGGWGGWEEWRDKKEVWESQRAMNREDEASAIVPERTPDPQLGPPPGLDDPFPLEFLRGFADSQHQAQPPDDRTRIRGIDEMFGWNAHEAYEPPMMSNLFSGGFGSILQSPQPQSRTTTSAIDDALRALIGPHLHQAYGHAHFTATGQMGDGRRTSITGGRFRDLEDGMARLFSHVRRGR